jgi:hypothetical protein
MVVGEWHVSGGDELQAALHELRNKSHVSGQPVELGHHKPGLQMLTAASAAASCGQLFRMPLSTSTKTSFQFPRSRKSRTALRSF